MFDSKQECAPCLTDRETKNIINDIYDVIVEHIICTDIVHHISTCMHKITMKLAQNNLQYYVSLVSFYHAIFLNLFLLVIDFISVDRLSHISMPW